MNAQTVLIHAVRGDLHALVVEAALRDRGCLVHRLLGDDFPQHAEVEWHYSTAAADRRVHAGASSWSLDDIDTVWIRRTGASRLPDTLANGDRAFAASECAQMQSALRLLCDDAFCLNPWYAARRADHKPLQLQRARALGLQIPPTLISNRPEAIRQFIERHDEVIYKPLRGAIWQEAGTRYGTYTTRVRIEDLPSDALLRCTPGIFQQRVAKKFEVRAQFFGASVFAIALESGLAASPYDWRVEQGGHLAAGAVELPPLVQARCRALMRELGLVSGAFDFIVTPDDDWVFLEVNEGGQFLFVELWCPQLPLIDALCDFLQSRDPDFIYRPTGPIQTLAALQRDHALNRISEQELAAAAAAPRVPEPAA